MGLIDLGLVDGNYWNAFDVDSLENAINTGQPPAMCVMTFAATPPAGWLFVSGQVITNFQGLYPQAWPLIPASWKSGSSVTLPNMELHVPLGASSALAVGSMGGTNSKTITTSNLPSHTHSINHTHANTSYVSSDHSHSGTTGPENRRHVHTPNGFGYFVAQNLGAGQPNALNVSAGTGATVGNANSTAVDQDAYGAAIDHGHPFTTGGISANHTHTVPGFAGPSGSVGSDVPLDTTPAFVAVNFMMRVY